MLRMVRPGAVRQLARDHDAGLFQCLCRILQIEPTVCDQESRETAALPLVLDGLGLRSAERIATPAYWANWADYLQMLNERHPTVAEECVRQLEGEPHSEALTAAKECFLALQGAAGFYPPSWREAMRGTRPPLKDPLEFEPGGHMGGRGGGEGAARSGTSCGFPLSRWRPLPPCPRRNQGVDQISSRTHNGIGIFNHTHVKVHEVGCPRVQNSLASSPSSPFAPVRPLLPVWPSTRPKWPPPRNLLSGRGVGKERVCPRKRNSPNLPRRGWPRQD